MDKVYNASEYRSRFYGDVCFGELNQKAEPVKLFFPFKSPNEFCDIPTNELGNAVAHYNLNCPCLNNFIIREDGFEVTFYPANAGIGDTDRMAYWATFRVFFKDDQELYEKNNIGQLVLNSNKANITLEVFGTINKQ